MPRHCWLLRTFESPIPDQHEIVSRVIAERCRSDGNHRSVCVVLVRPLPRWRDHRRPSSPIVSLLVLMSSAGQVMSFAPNWDWWSEREQTGDHWCSRYSGWRPTSNPLFSRWSAADSMGSNGLLLVTMSIERQRMDRRESTDGDDRWSQKGVRFWSAPSCFEWTDRRERAESKRGRRWKGRKLDKRDAELRHWWHRHVRRLIGSLIARQALFNFVSCLFSGSMQLFRWALINSWLERFLISWFSFLLPLEMKSERMLMVADDGMLDTMGTFDFFAGVTSHFLLADAASLFAVVVESSVEAILYT